MAISKSDGFIASEPREESSATSLKLKACEYAKLDATRVCSLGFFTKAPVTALAGFFARCERNRALLFQSMRIPRYQLWIQTAGDFEYVLCPCPCASLSVLILTFCTSLSSSHSPDDAFVMLYAAQRWTPTSLRLHGWFRRWFLRLLVAP